MMRELFERANTKLRENLTGAASTLTSIIQNPELDPKIRADVAKWLIERTMGKTPDINITVDEKRYENLFNRLERDAGVVEGEVVSMEGYEP